MLNKDEFLKRQDELDTEAKGIWGTGAFLDGVVNYDQYAAAPVRILWILKEFKIDYKDYDKSRRNWRHFLDVMDYSPFTTYGKVMATTYGMFNNLFAYDKDTFKTHIKEDSIGTDNDHILSAIAQINVIKSPNATDKLIRTPGTADYAHPDAKELLFKQIDLIAPDVIINCHHVCQFIKDQCGSAQMRPCIEGTKYPLYAVVDGRLIFDTYHPACRFKYEDYCNPLLKTFEAHSELKEGRVIIK
jgi:hypothetical protein